jgi:diphosphoinositol-polyphosphate diphosphatase
MTPFLTPLLQINSRALHLCEITADPRDLAGVKGLVTCFVTTIQSTTAIYHVYELDVTSLEETWLESNERAREWVDYAEAVRRLQWKPELAQALSMCSVAPRR